MPKILVDFFSLGNPDPPLYDLFMKNKSLLHSNAFLGSLVADAVSMPVHWYYDTTALKRDYGVINTYLAPRNPHPDSKNQVHYHQKLRAGENTLNYQIARQLASFILQLGGYDLEIWAKTYVEFLRTPGKHNDSYVEGAHRAFLENLAQGKKLFECGTPNVDIGGLVPVPALFYALGPEHPQLREIVQKHVSLTHQDKTLLRAADALAVMLTELAHGTSLREVILTQGSEWISEKKFDQWMKEPDEVVVGKHLSQACPIVGSFPASLYLAWKYSEDFSAGVCNNAQVGGDNCHRGAVVGSLLGASLGVPNTWSEGLLTGINQ
jgi:ADP-ribosyl-[dinitrogen reductase] hydrolase